MNARRQRKGSRPTKARTPKHDMEGLYPMQTTIVLVVYDLRDVRQWEQAGRDRRAWGREMTQIHALDDDHVVIEFMAGGALGASA